MQRRQVYKRRQPSPIDLLESDIEFGVDSHSDCSDMDAQGNTRRNNGGLKTGGKRPQRTEGRYAGPVYQHNNGHRGADRREEERNIGKGLNIDNLLKIDVPWLPVRHHVQQLFEGLPKEPINRLSAEIQSFCDFVSANEDEKEAEMLTYARLCRVVQRRWPSAELKVFGSAVIESRILTSDIDIVVCCREFRSSDFDELGGLVFQTGLAEAGSVEVIGGARVPIVRYRDMATKMMVDVSMNVRETDQTLGWVNEAKRRHPALIPLVQILKQMLEVKGLRCVFTGGVGSFTLLVMVSCFLEQHPLVQAGLIDELNSLGALLVDLLYLYGRSLRYDRTGMCPTGFMRKRREDIPVQLFVTKDETDGFGISNGTRKLFLIRAVFFHGYKSLVAVMNRLPPEKYSLLSAVIDLPEAHLEHRRCVVEGTRSSRTSDGSSASLASL